MKKALLFICLLALSGSAAWYVSQGDKVAAPASQPAPFVLGELTKEYTSDAFSFSLKMPADFSARIIPAEGGETLILENGAGEGIQIIVTPFDEDLTELSADRIHTDVPEMKIVDPLPVEIGINHRGLAFKSDNPEFDGASREVWFVFRGNLYQISTYERLDPLLRAIFATWQFK